MIYDEGSKLVNNLILKERKKERLLLLIDFLLVINLIHLQIQ